MDTEESKFENTVVGGFCCQPQSRDSESDLVRPPATTDNHKKGVVKYLRISSFAS